MWRINREAVLLGAGPAALLLQIAHPLVAEGVAAHSDFEGDPFGRLRRTLNTTMELVFGDGPTAERAIRRLNGVHATVTGPGYRALDPELLLWVQATLIVTSVRAYRRWVGPLSREDLDEFWSEARSVGVRMGIPLRVSPSDWRALTVWWDRMLAPDGPIQVTPTALALAPMIVRPPLPLAPSWTVDLLALPGLGLLPERLRAAYGIEWSPIREHGSRWLGRAVRLWTTATPAGWRSMPQARAAFRRARGYSNTRSRGADALSAAS
jgi:uncharacterized protein (DUF2236 family)